VSLKEVIMELAGPPSSGDPEPWKVVAGFVMLAAMLLWQLAVLFNYKGYRDYYVRRIIGPTGRLQHSLHRRLRTDPEAARHYVTRTAKAVSGIMVVGFVFMMVAAALSLR
jgi:hypothetical protein